MCKQIFYNFSVHTADNFFFEKKKKEYGSTKGKLLCSFIYTRRNSALEIKAINASTHSEHGQQIKLCQSVLIVQIQRNLEQVDCTGYFFPGKSMKQREHTLTSIRSRMQK